MLKSAFILRGPPCDKNLVINTLQFWDDKKCLANDEFCKAFFLFFQQIQTNIASEIPPFKMNLTRSFCRYIHRLFKRFSEGGNG
jgi:hypothetical protein